MQGIVVPIGTFQGFYGLQQPDINVMRDDLHSFPTVISISRDYSPSIHACHYGNEKNNKNLTGHVIAVCFTS